MSQFSPDVSPALNLKNHISSAICEFTQVLENLMLSGCNENQLDYTLYKLEQVVYLCLPAKYLPDFVSDEFIELLLTAHNSFPKKTLKTILDAKPSNNLYRVDR